LAQVIFAQAVVFVASSRRSRLWAPILGPSVAMYRSVVASFFVAVVAQELPELEQLGAKCQEAVSELGRRGLNDQEVAAFCRAAYSPELCSSMRSALGSQPWSEDRVTAACQGWQDRLLPKLLAMPPERRAMSLQDLHDTLDSCANEKAKIGVELPRQSDGRVDFERTVYLKYQETQRVQDMYNQYMNASSVDGTPDATQDISRLFEEERHGVLAAHSVVVSAATGIGLVSLLTAATVTARRYLRRTPEVAEGMLEELPILEE